MEPAGAERHRRESPNGVSFRGRKRIKYPYLFCRAQLHAIYQRLARAQIADDHQLVAGRSQFVFAQEFLGRFDRRIRILREIELHGIGAPTQRQLPIDFFTWREGKDGCVLRP